MFLNQSLKFFQSLSLKSTSHFPHKKQQTPKSDCIESYVCPVHLGRHAASPTCPLRLALVQEFLKHLDFSYLIMLSQKSTAQLDRQFLVLGEGRHFRAWKVPIRTFSRTYKAPSAIRYLVLKKPLPSFYDDLYLTRRPWFRYLRILEHAPTQTLICPFKVLTGPHFNALETEDKNLNDKNRDFSLIMPFGEIKPAKSAPEKTFSQEHFKRDLNKQLVDTERWLFKHQLKLNDIPQIRWIEGLPFIVDLSDICRI